MSRSWKPLMLMAVPVICGIAYQVAKGLDTNKLAGDILEPELTEATEKVESSVAEAQPTDTERNTSEEVEQAKLDPVQEDHHNQILALQAQETALQESIATLQETHESKVACYRDEEQSFRSNIDALNETHRKKMASFRETELSSTKKLDILKEEHQQKKAAFEEEEQSWTDKLAALNEDHKNKMASFQKKEKASTDKLDALNNTHEKKMASFREDEKTLKEMVHKLSDTYKDKMAFLEKKEQSLQNKLDALNIEHESKKTSFHAEEQSLRKKLDASKTAHEEKLAAFLHEEQKVKNKVDSLDKVYAESLALLQKEASLKEDEDALKAREGTLFAQEEELEKKSSDLERKLVHLRASQEAVETRQVELEQWDNELQEAEANNERNEETLEGQRAALSKDEKNLAQREEQLIPRDNAFKTKVDEVEKRIKDIQKHQNEHLKEVETYKVVGKKQEAKTAELNSHEETLAAKEAELEEIRANHLRSVNEKEEELQRREDTLTQRESNMAMQILESKDASDPVTELDVAMVDFGLGNDEASGPGTQPQALVPLSQSPMAIEDSTSSSKTQRESLFSVSLMDVEDSSSVISDINDEDLYDPNPQDHKDEPVPGRGLDPIYGVVDRSNPASEKEDAKAPTVQGLMASRWAPSTTSTSDTKMDIIIETKPTSKGVFDFSSPKSSASAPTNEVPSSTAARSKPPTAIFGQTSSMKPPTPKPKPSKGLLGSSLSPSDKSAAIEQFIAIAKARPVPIKPVFEAGMLPPEPKQLPKISLSEAAKLSAIFQGPKEKAPTTPAPNNQKVQSNGSGKFGKEQPRRVNTVVGQFSGRTFAKPRQSKIGGGGKKFGGSVQGKENIAGAGNATPMSLD